VVEHLGLNQTEVDLSDCWTLSSRWLPASAFDWVDHPGQDAGHMALSAAAGSAGLGVALGGDGGDEWLAGGRLMTGQACIADAVLRGRPDAGWRIARAALPGRSPLATVARSCYQELLPDEVRRLSRTLRGRGPDAQFAREVEADRRWTSITRFSQVPAWQRRRSAEMQWRLYRQLSGPLSAWRERQALARYGVEYRIPFNDLRVINLLAGTPEWVKRFRGRPKDLLREAEYRVLPRAIPDRQDYGLYTELFEAGVRVHERERVRRAVDAIAAFPGVDGAAVRAAVDRWIATPNRWWLIVWRFISAGLWLEFLSDSYAAPAGWPSLQSNLTREEVTA
jgi:asparagine synthetase B (glutamine-hydrolysing)